MKRVAPSLARPANGGLAAAALVATTCALSACSFFTWFPDEVAFEGESGGNPPGGGGQGGAGGGPTGGGGSEALGCGAGDPDVSLQLGVDPADGAYSILTGLAIDGDDLIVAGQYGVNLQIGAELIPDGHPTRGNHFVARYGAVDEYIGLTRECDNPGSGWPYSGRGVAALNGSYYVGGAQGMTPATTIGFGSAGEVPCDAPVDNPTADPTGWLVPYVGRFGAQTGYAISEGPSNAVVQKVVSQGDNVYAMGITYHEVFESDPSSYAYFVTRFDADLQVEDTGLYGFPAYDSSDPNRDFGDVAVDDSGTAWATGRTCNGNAPPDCTFIFRRGSSGYPSALVDIVANPSSAESVGSAVAVSGDYVFVGGTLEGSLFLDDGDGESVQLQGQGMDSFLIVLDRTTQQIVWAKTFGFTGFDAVRAIVARTDDCGGTVYVTGCAGGEFDCDDYGPGQPGTSAYVIAFDLASSEERWRKVFTVDGSELESPLSLTAETLLLRQNELLVGLQARGDVREEEGLVLAPTSNFNRQYLAEGMVVTIPLQMVE